MNKRIYIASPLGFSEVGRFFMVEKIFPILTRLGYGIIDPWSLTPQDDIDAITRITDTDKRKTAWGQLNPIIGKRNSEGIKQSTGVVAVLDGVDVDSGTASEIGFAAALGKPVLGYRGDFRLSADNEGSIVNLQVEYFIRCNGGDIVTNIIDLERMLPLIIK